MCGLDARGDASHQIDVDDAVAHREGVVATRDIDIGCSGFLERERDRQGSVADIDARFRGRLGKGLKVVGSEPEPTLSARFADGSSSVVTATLEGGVVEHCAVVVGADGAEALADLLEQLAFVVVGKLDAGLWIQHGANSKLHLGDAERRARADAVIDIRVGHCYILWSHEHTLERLDATADVEVFVANPAVKLVVAVGGGGQREHPARRCQGERCSQSERRIGRSAVLLAG
jgi:hypothetical protein